MAYGSGHTSAQTFELKDGEIYGTITTTLSAGISVSTADPSKNLYTYGESKGNDDIPNGNGVGVNADNGRLNFEKGDVISNQYKGLTELTLEYQNYGVKGSIKYWYDHWLETKSGRYNDFDDTGFDDLASFSGIELLEAYAWTYFDIDNKPVDIRLGKQVVTWGEGLFLSGGINAINPIDIAAFNRPGVELKEGLLPVEMLYGSISLTPDITIESFYQLKWRASVLDGCHTFFASSDVIQPGCEPIYTQADLSNAQEENPLISGRSVIDRTSDDLPGDSGQWGISVKYYAEELNGSEFGFYYINYHSRLPYLSVTNANPTVSVTGGFPLPGVGTVQGPKYNAAFPEDIDLYGISFNSSLDSGWSVAGEISYRPDMPLQLNTNNLIATAAGGGGAPALYGQPAQGYALKPVTQIQLSAINTFPQVLGASELSVAGEIGFIHIGDLKDGNTYGRSGLFGTGPAASNCQYRANITREFCEDEGYTTSNSWGYRLRAGLTYSGILPAVTFKPSLSFRHDVSGYAYMPGGAFEEDQMATTLGLDAIYLDNYKAAFAYTNFFGNNKYSTRDDRDFISFSLSASF
ncbi:DUF1302 domain-containing protein [uncultured Endozoicomonas sp.]|uniref:DUF1302 domain-containing protein n=1 Tax=uncultured Endozoicomonas sp. TaxID=432652 RepID=UPI00262B5BE0|nr:DUF1302 domain-containing protein [uncultured Endozoicomonas sp.]